VHTSPRDAGTKSLSPSLCPSLHLSHLPLYVCPAPPPPARALSLLFLPHSRSLSLCFSLSLSLFLSPSPSISLTLTLFLNLPLFSSGEAGEVGKTWCKARLNINVSSSSSSSSSADWTVSPAGLPGATRAPLFLYLSVARAHALSHTHPPPPRPLPPRCCSPSLVCFAPVRSYNHSIPYQQHCNALLPCLPPVSAPPPFPLPILSPPRPLLPLLLRQTSPTHSAPPDSEPRIVRGPPCPDGPYPSPPPPPPHPCPRGFSSSTEGGSPRPPPPPPPHPCPRAFLLLLLLLHGGGIPPPPPLPPHSFFSSAHLVIRLLPGVL
jgi:hypothetical protein